MKDIYRAREKGKPIIEQRMVGKDEGAQALLLRHRLSVVFFALLILAFVGLLIGIIYYQQRQIAVQRRASQESLAVAGTEPEETPSTAIYSVDVDPTGRLLPDELAPDELSPLPEDGSAPPLTIRWVKEAATYLRQAERAYEIRDWRAAARAYQNVLQILPGLADVSERLGLCHLRLEDYAAAEARFADRVKAQSGSAPLWNNLGVARLGQKKYDEAEAALLKAAELNPSYAPARQNLALLYFRKGDMGKAADLFQRCLRENTATVDMVHMYAVALMKLERWEEAAQMLEESSRRFDQAAPVFFRLAEALSRTGRPEPAMAALKKGVALLDPNGALVWLTRKEFDLLRPREDFQKLVIELTNASK